MRRDQTEQNQQALDAFLAGIERRAFLMARTATGQPEEALDLVQDAMLAFVRGYGKRPEDEWGALFHRVMQNRIRDWYRRHKVRSRWRVWFGGEAADDRREDPIQTAPDPAMPDPARTLARSDAGDALIEAVEALPLRQQQAFILRTLEGLDVAQTAAAMGCSAGSVKTHLSRAMQALRKKLKDHWP
ncbi:RNA polymerase sigma factor [bacterium endosymbiont of Escarpia laminata]|nr:MAG: RNA polymerase sigma factor [bacterium endosymbiont of Escarpia laminata]